MDTRGGFPSTHWSLLKPGGGNREAGLEALARLYGSAIYAHFRLKWTRPHAEAADLTQDFFLWILQSDFLEKAEPGHGRFRNFVRAHIDNYMRNYLRAGKRIVRGGDRRFYSIDEQAADSLVRDSRHVSPDEVLDRQWRTEMLREALERLRRVLEAEGRGVVFEVLRRYDLADPPESRPSYTELAKDLGLKPSDIDNHLSSARKRLYELLREVVAESVDGPEALREELDFFFPGR